MGLHKNRDFVAFIGGMSHSERSRKLLRAVMMGIRWEMPLIDHDPNVSWQGVSSALSFAVAMGVSAIQCMIELAVCHIRVSADGEPTPPFVETMTSLFSVARSQANADVGHWAREFARSVQSSLSHVGDDEIRRKILLDIVIAVMDCDDPLVLEQIFEWMDDHIDDTTAILMMERAVTRALPSSLELVTRRRPDSVARLLRNLDDRCKIDDGYEGIVSVDVHPHPMRKKRERVQKMMAILLTWIRRSRGGGGRVKPILRHLLCGALTTCCTFKFSHRSVETVLWEAGGRGSHRVSDIIPLPVLDRCMELMGSIFPSRHLERVDATDPRCIAMTLKDPFSFASTVHALRLAGASFSKEVQTILAERVILVNASLGALYKSRVCTDVSNCYGLCAYLLREVQEPDIIMRLVNAVLNSPSEFHGRLHTMVCKKVVSRSIDGLQIDPMYMETIQKIADRGDEMVRFMVETAYAPPDQDFYVYTTRKSERDPREEICVITEVNSGSGGVGFLKCMKRCGSGDDQDL